MEKALGIKQMQIQKRWAEFSFIAAQDRNGEGGGDAAVGLAELIRLDRGVPLAILKNQGGLILQHFNNLAARAVIVDMQADQAAQLRQRARGSEFSVCHVSMLKVVRLKSKVRLKNGDSPAERTENAEKKDLGKLCRVTRWVKVRLTLTI